MTDTSTEIADTLRDALGTRTSLVHPTYRHLARPITIAGLNRAQWLIGIGAAALICAFTAAAPLSAQWALSLGGTLIGAPASTLFVLTADGELSLRQLARGVRSWRRSRRVLLPVEPAALATEGYALLGPAQAPAMPFAGVEAGPVTITELWS
jgi:hypothetical protein